MSEWIKREDAVDQFALYLIERDEDEKEDRIKEWQNTYTAEAHHVSELIPAADVEPVRHGYWIDNGDFVICSCCTEFYVKRFNLHRNYCPNCGAKMDGEEQEHE